MEILIHLVEAGFNNFIVLVEQFLDSLDKTEPVSIFISICITSLNEHDELDLPQLSSKLVLDLEVVEVDFGLVDITIDCSLVNDPLISLGDNSNEIVK